MNFQKAIVFSIVFILLVSCQKSPSVSYTNNTIAAAHPLASLAGKKMFEQGGNAFDAAVAAGFSLAVVEPSMSGIGGRLQALYRQSDGQIGGVDAATQVPQGYTSSDNKYAHGYPTIGIPGVVAGLLKLHNEHGKLPLTKVMQPAIDYAENGFELLPGEALRQQSDQQTIALYEGSRMYFLNAQGNAYSAGDQVVQKDLAYTLKQIAEKGQAGFYEGEIAKKMVDDIQTHGGILSLDDLKNYNALDAEILHGQFQGNTIHSLYLPSYGAITIQILQLLDHFKNLNSEEDWEITVGEVTEFAYSYRQHQQNRDSLNSILSYQKAGEWALKMQENTLQNVAQESSMPPSWTVAIGHTTHLTAADAYGNVVALTQTIGPNMGSKVATPGLGFLYAVTLGGYLGEYKPGDRSNSHISPTLFTKDNEVILALGAAGGSRIVTAVTQVADRYLKQKRSLAEALMMPRVYPFRDSLWIEDHEGIKELNAVLDPTVYPLKWIDEKASFGRVHAIALDANNKAWIGAADPDWEGTVETHLHK